MAADWVKIRFSPELDVAGKLKPFVETSPVTIAQTPLDTLHFTMEVPDGGLKGAENSGQIAYLMGQRPAPKMGGPSLVQFLYKNTVDESWREVVLYPLDHPKGLLKNPPLLEVGSVFFFRCYIGNASRVECSYAVQNEA